MEAFYKRAHDPITQNMCLWSNKPIQRHHLVYGRVVAYLCAPLVFPSDDFAEAMADTIVQVHKRQLAVTGGFTGKVPTKLAS